MIKKGIAFLLLLAFVVSRAPLQYLHDSFAHHHDKPTSCSHSDQRDGCFHALQHHCVFAGVFTVSDHFTEYINSFESGTLAIQITHGGFPDQACFHRSIPFDNRGPPYYFI